MSERWTTTQEGALRDIAASGLSAAIAAIAARVLCRTKAAVYAKASHRGIQFTRAAAATEDAIYERLIAVVRDEIDGFGIHWSLASRSGEIDINTPACDHLYSLGLLRLIHGSTYVAA